MPNDPVQTLGSLRELTASLAAIGRPYEAALLVAAVLLAAIALAPAARPFRGRALAAMALFIAAGEATLIWFHYRLWRLCAVIDPSTGSSVGRVAVPLWIESEKLFVWALVVAVLGASVRRHRDELLSGILLVTAVLAAGAALQGRPFSEPLPGFLGQYIGFLQASAAGGEAARAAFQGMYGSMRYYYNAWYMWVHPPLLFLSYGAFSISFLATLLMIARRHSSYETTAYRWARFGYLPLTFGMLLGFPWAILAWTGEAWWWSGKVNMSIMLWLLYTAVLHARLYLRRAGMWRLVAALSVLSFVVLVLTYLATYVVPGAHSYASAAPDGVIAAAAAGSGWEDGS